MGFDDLRTGWLERNVGDLKYFGTLFKTAMDDDLPLGMVLMFDIPVQPSAAPSL